MPDKKSEDKSTFRGLRTPLYQGLEAGRIETAVQSPGDGCAGSSFGQLLIAHPS